MVRSFEEGELDELKTSILPFLKTHKTQLKAFIEKFGKGKDVSLEFLIKYFDVTPKKWSHS